MKKAGKRYRAALELAKQAGVVKNLAQGVSLVKQTAKAKFDETIVVSSHLGVDPRHSEQLVRGTVVLPHGTGKSLRVLVLCKGEKEKEALAAGADFAGASPYVQKIQEGWLEVDAIVATPDMMGEVGKLGRVLGPRGLMPNPKSGTVTFDVAKAVRELKASSGWTRAPTCTPLWARPRSARTSCWRTLAPSCASWSGRSRRRPRAPISRA